MRTAVLPWALQGQTLQGDVLEVGSGSGAMAAEILRRFRDLTLTATDYDERMVELAASELSDFGLRARVLRADATALPFADESFDGVLSFLMLHHVGDWERALRESARVLRPGGLLIGYDLLSMRPTKAAHRITHKHGERLIRRGELEPALRRLPFGDVHVRESGPLVRFHAAKKGDR